MDYCIICGQTFTIGESGFKDSNNNDILKCKDCIITNLKDIGNKCNGNYHKLCKIEECQKCYDKSFASSDKVKYWSQTNIKSPRCVCKRSNFKYWFNCDQCGHTFSNDLNSITRGRWCSFCGNDQLCQLDTCQICFNKSFASVDKALYWSQINIVLPRSVFKYSNKKYWFKCDVCFHTFETQLNNISSGKWCHYCSNHKLCEDSTCQICFNKSFASSDKVQYWSLINTKLPRSIFKCSSHKYWFTCQLCSHDFDCALDTINAGTWCPYCSHHKLCDNYECMSCLKNSFALSDKAQYWSQQNILLPRQLFLNSNINMWFTCNLCCHDFNMKLSEVTKGKWCHYCSHHKLCDNNTCQLCLKNSFASSDKAQYWSTKNTAIPRQLFKSSKVKMWFDCDQCNHDFDMRLYDVNTGYWCPYCYNKTETMIYDFCKSLYQTQSQFKPDWCKNVITNRHLPYDLLLENHKLIIECDGCQHFKDMTFWSSFVTNVQSRDIYKMNKCLENGYSMLRLVQEEVYQNKFDWKAKIVKIVNSLSQQMEPNIWFYSLDETKYVNHDVLTKTIGNVNLTQIEDDDSELNNDTINLDISI